MCWGNKIALVVPQKIDVLRAAAAGRVIDGDVHNLIRLIMKKVPLEQREPVFGFDHQPCADR